MKNILIIISYITLIAIFLKDFIIAEGLLVKILSLIFILFCVFFGIYDLFHVKIRSIFKIDLESWDRIGNILYFLFLLVGCCFIIIVTYIVSPESFFLKIFIYSISIIGIIFNAYFIFLLIGNGKERISYLIKLMRGH